MARPAVPHAAADRVRVAPGKRESYAKAFAQRVLSLMQRGSEGATYGTLAKQLEDEHRHPRSVSDSGRHATRSE